MSVDIRGTLVILTDMTTAYTLADKPKNAELYEWDCLLCGHETLARPVFLAGPSGVIAAGTGCAAKALYGSADNVTRRKVRNAYDLIVFKSAQAEEMRVERMGRYGRALADLHADNWTPDLISAQRTYGNTTKSVGFFAFLETVATTGDIPS